MPELPAFDRPLWSPDRVRFAGTSRRTGGVSGGRWRSLNLGLTTGDDGSAVVANRERLIAASGLDNQPAWLAQVHGTTVIDTADWHEPAIEADAAIVRRGQRPAVVLTADCIPILLLAADGSVGAAVHAGWRGLAAGVIDAAIERVAQPPASLAAWIGPAIRQPEYEVGDDVRRAFSGGSKRFSRNAAGRWLADLPGLATDRLGRLGVTDIVDSGRCTAAESERYFSYRRDGQTGRMATILAL